MIDKEINPNNSDRLQAVTVFLKWYRINSGLTQLELSECSGIHRNTIVRYESCNPENLTLLTVFEIANALDIDINQIFMEIE
ncbi:MAG: helix-turn-helix transcriptional regulator [Bacteroidales bacterium]|nr:helix-turn-helix transcriptional regulator [Bacteroidales bacterium]